MTVRPQYFDYVRREIAPLLPPAPKRVLEIGCANGNTLKWLKTEMGAGETVGVEPHPQAHEAAVSNADRVINCRIEELPADVAGFDVILALDVLEHLVDPWAIVRDLKQRLTETGALIVSLPNVTHWSVAAPLLFSSRWHYTDSGILDRTHLRFFDRAGALDLLTQAGFAVDRGIRHIHAGARGLRFLNALTRGRFVDKLAVQFLLRGVRGFGPGETVWSAADF